MAFGIIEWRMQFGANCESFVHFDINTFIHPHDSEIWDLMYVYLPYLLAIIISVISQGAWAYIFFWMHFRLSLDGNTSAHA